MKVFIRLPQQSLRAAGILLLDYTSDHLLVKLGHELDDATDEVSVFWAELREELLLRSLEVGGGEVMAWLEENCSHTIQLGDRRHVQFSDAQRALDELFEEQIDSSS